MQACALGRVGEGGDYYQNMYKLKTLKEQIKQF